MDLAKPTTITFPSRWNTYKPDYQQSAKEINRLGAIIVAGCAAVTGVYMRLTDVIRQSSLTDGEVRQLLSMHFPQSRVSEIIRVARAPQEIYSRYTAGFFGFKAALSQCRLYHITPTKELNQRRLTRAAKRLVELTNGAGQVRIQDKLITITQA